MKKIISLLGILTLSVCAVEPNGTFTATMGDKHYNIPVTCYYLGSDEFTFISDDGKGYKDTDGDGITVRGDRKVVANSLPYLAIDGITLNIKDNGVHYESKSGELIKMYNKTAKWSKTDKGVKGTSELVKGEEFKGTLMHYEVICK